MAKEKFTPIPLHIEMQRSYLEYAMSVIVGRALPDARDGLKPVQRRILFAMHELGLTPDRPFRKCARVVGDVLGKYHPHGDQAVYDALVRLVQDFSTKYPTLDGHGNFGSVDDDPPAAMRYTETRLAPIANEALLQEIGSETVEYSDNFDGSQKEPDVLPAQLPFLLLNGSSGIAVGMATNIPPHNIGEVIDALIYLIKNHEISNSKLNQIIKGPDFPTGGELVYDENISDLYEKGRGSITIRGVIHQEEINLGKGKHKRSALIISELPYQISKAGWIEKLAELVNNGKINGIADIRDESDRDGMRILIELKREYNHELVISDLYKKTTLQTNFGVIFLALVEGKPVQLSLRNYLNHFLAFREATIRKRTNYLLNITTDKLEVLEGFALAISNIQKIINIVQQSEDSGEAKYILKKEISLTNRQAEAVLGMPIKKLTNLERLNITRDKEDLLNKKKYLKSILEDRKILLETLIDELKILKQKYNQNRKTKIIKNINQVEELEQINERMIEELIYKKTKLNIDKNFYLKKLIIGNYKKIAEKNTTLKPNKNTTQFICNINKDLKILALNKLGKVFQINWEKSINNDLKLDHKILGNTSLNEILNFHNIEKNTPSYLCLLSNDGRFKKILIDENMIESNRSYNAIKLKKDNEIIDSFISNQNQILIILTSIGRLFKFSLNDKFIAPSSKQAQGIALIKLFPTEKIISCCNSTCDGGIAIATKNGKIYKLENKAIFDSSVAKLGYINEKINIKKDAFIKIFDNKKIITIETNKERSANINLSEVDFLNNKYLYKTEFITFEKDEFISKIYTFDNWLD